MIEGEIRQLERSRLALEQALAQARREEARMAEALAAALKKVTHSTYRAVSSPADFGIPKRLTAALNAAYLAASSALSACWADLRLLIHKALTKVLDELDTKRRMLRGALN